MYYSAFFRYNVDLFRYSITNFIGQGAVLESSDIFYSLLDSGISSAFRLLCLVFNGIYGVSDGTLEPKAVPLSKSLSAFSKILLDTTLECWSLASMYLPFNFNTFGVAMPAVFNNAVSIVYTIRRGIYTPMCHYDFRDRYTVYDDGDLINTMRCSIYENLHDVRNRMAFSFANFSKCIDRINELDEFSNFGVHAAGTLCIPCMRFAARSCVVDMIGRQCPTASLVNFDENSDAFETVSTVEIITNACIATYASLMPLMPYYKTTMPWFYNDIGAVQLRSALLYSAPAVFDEYFCDLEQLDMLDTLYDTQDVVDDQVVEYVVDTYKNRKLIGIVDDVIKDKYGGPRSFLFRGVLATTYMDFLYSKSVKIGNRSYSPYDVLCMIASHQEMSEQKAIFSQREFEDIVDPFHLLYFNGSLITNVFSTGSDSPFHPRNFVKFLFGLNLDELINVNSDITHYTSTLNDGVDVEKKKLDGLSNLLGYVSSMIVRPKINLLSALSSHSNRTLIYPKLHSSLLAIRGRRLDYTSFYNDLVIGVLESACESLPMKAMIPLLKPEFAQFIEYADYRHSACINGHTAVSRCFDVPIKVCGFDLLIQCDDNNNQIDIYDDHYIPYIGSMSLKPHGGVYDRKSDLNNMVLLSFVDYILMYCRYSLSGTLAMSSKFYVPIFRSFREPVAMYVMNIAYDYLPSVIRNWLVVSNRDMFGTYVRRASNATLVSETQFVKVDSSIYYNILGDVVSYGGSPLVVGDIIANGLFNWLLRTYTKACGGDYVNIPNDYIKYTLSHLNNVRLLLSSRRSDDGEDVEHYLALNLSNIVCGRLYKFERYLVSILPKPIVSMLQVPQLVYIDMVRRGLIYNEGTDICTSIEDNIMYSIFGNVTDPILLYDGIIRQCSCIFTDFISGFVKDVRDLKSGLYNNWMRRNKPDVDILDDDSEQHVIEDSVIDCFTSLVTRVVMKSAFAIFLGRSPLIYNGYHSGHYNDFNDFSLLCINPHLSFCGLSDRLSGRYIFTCGHLHHNCRFGNSVLAKSSVTNYNAVIVAYLRHMAYFDYSNDLLLKLLEFDYYNESNCSFGSDKCLVQFCVRDFVRDFLWEYNTCLGFDLSKSITGRNHPSMAFVYDLNYPISLSYGVQSDSNNSLFFMDSFVSRSRNIMAPFGIYGYLCYLDDTAIDDPIYMGLYMPRPLRTPLNDFVRSIWNNLLFKYPLFVYFAHTADLLCCGPSVMAGVVRGPYYMSRVYVSRVMAICAHFISATMVVLDKNLMVSFMPNETRAFSEPFSNKGPGIRLFAKYPVPVVANNRVYVGKPIQYLMVKTTRNLGFAFSLPQVMQCINTLFAARASMLSFDRSCGGVMNLMGFGGPNRYQPVTPYLTAVGGFAWSQLLFIDLIIRSAVFMHYVGFSGLPDWLLLMNSVTPISGDRYGSIGMHIFSSNKDGVLSEYIIYPFSLIREIAMAGESIYRVYYYFGSNAYSSDTRTVIVAIGLVYRFFSDFINIMCGGLSKGTRILKVNKYHSTDIDDHGLSMKYVNGDQCISFGMSSRSKEGRSGIVGGIICSLQTLCSSVASRATRLSSAVSGLFRSENEDVEYDDEEEENDDELDEVDEVDEVNEEEN